MHLLAPASAMLVVSFSQLTSFFSSFLFLSPPFPLSSTLSLALPLCLALHFSCSPSLPWYSNWMSFQVKGTSLPRALQCWDKSLQEANRNSKTPLKGCPFHLVDACQWPQCNPTCPTLMDQATQQELTLFQMLVGMGLDLQKLGLDPKKDGAILTSMVSNGG